MNLFVYGSMRPGQYNYTRTRLDEESIVVARNVRTLGRMKPIDGFDSYPVVDFCTHTEQFVIGDVLDVNPNSRAYNNGTDMEVGAGYVPVVVKVDTKLVEGEETSYVVEWQHCIAWHYPHFDDVNQPVLTHGDWVALVTDKNGTGSPRHGLTR